MWLVSTMCFISFSDIVFLECLLNDLSFKPLLFTRDWWGSIQLVKRQNTSVKPHRPPSQLEGGSSNSATQYWVFWPAWLAVLAVCLDVTCWADSVTWMTFVTGVGCQCDVNDRLFFTSSGSIWIVPLWNGATGEKLDHCGAPCFYVTFLTGLKKQCDSCDSATFDYGDQRAP